MSIVDELYSEIDNGREGRNLGLKLDYQVGLIYRRIPKGVYKLIFGQSGSGKVHMPIYSDLHNKVYYEIIQIENIVHVYFSLEMSSKVFTC